MSDTLQTLASILGGALRPFAEVFDRGDDDLLNWFEQLGYQLPSVPPSLKNLQGNAQDLMRALNTLEGKLEEPAPDEQIGAATAEVLVKVITLAGTIGNLHSTFAAELPPAFVAATNIAADVETRLYDYAVWHALDQGAPGLRQVFTVLGILESTERPEDAAHFQPEFELKQVYWGRILQLLSDPGGVFRDVYGWGTPTLNAEKLFENLRDLSIYLMMPAELDYPEDSFIQKVAAGGVIDPNDGPDPMLQVPLFSLSVVTISLLFYALPKANAAELQGLAVTLTGAANIEEAIPIAERWTLQIDASLEIALGLALVFRPGQAVSVINDVLGAGPASPITAGHLLFRLIYGPAQGESKTRLLTIPGGSYLEAENISASAGVGLVSASDFDVLWEVALNGGVFMFTMAESDGFLASILPRDGFKVTFDAAVGWTRSVGIYFKGSASLEIQLPLHLEIGPIKIGSLYLKSGFSGSKVPVEVSTQISAQLGPLAASVDRLGIILSLDFSGSGGNLGAVDLSFQFKPPNGVGLSVDAGVVKGGGYLYLDYEKGEYAGALELVFSGWINLTAIGLINTKMPDGSTGFSLLIIITAQFGTGFQLGYGFVLLGVGGLLGLNRTMRLQPLMEGVRSGAINGIMFPTDVVANAPRIISDLRTIFPPENGKFLIGPMAKLGWGTPALISISLGIIIEIPGNIAILGVLKVALPAEQAPLLVLQVNFAGAIEFDKQRLYFFASLFESRVIFITIDGEMGLLVAWGGDANFVISVGGFHPRFTPPPLPFPSPNRIALNILNHDNARIRLMGYFAVTSNTVQFGARAELYFGFSCCNISGFMAFDALIQFDPFYFIVEISAGLSLKVFGIGLFSVGLRFSLEGPTPWRARGTFSFSIFWIISIDISFDRSWGETQDTSLPPIEVMPLLEAELKKLSNWSAQAPASASGLLVSLRTPAASTTEVVLHPAGTLRVSQRAVPLDITIAKVGNQKTGDANLFTLSASGDLARLDDATEPFAMGQFLELDNAAKLTRKSFDGQHSGLLLSAKGDQITSSKMAKRVVRYETVIIDSNYKRFVLHFFTFWKGLFGHFLAGNAAAKSALSAAGKKQFQPFAEKIAVTADLYTVALTSTNGAYRPESAAFASEALAHEYLRAQVRGDPTLAEQLHVIPRAEVNGSV